MSVFLAIVWFLLMAILGACAFIAAPLIASLIAGDSLRDWAGQYYLDLAMATVEDVALTVRETGSLTLTPVHWNPKMQGDQASIDGVVGHWQDPLSVKSTLRGKPFGIGLESASAYISPLAAECGHYGKQALNAGRLGVQHGDNDDDDSERTDPDEDCDQLVGLDYTIPETPQVMDLREAGKFLKGSCKRRWGALAYQWGKISQEKFHQRLSASETLILIGSFAVGVGLAFLLVKYGGSAGGGGGTVVPI